MIYDDCSCSFSFFSVTIMLSFYIYPSSFQLSFFVRNFYIFYLLLLHFSRTLEIGINRMDTGHYYFLPSFCLLQFLIFRLLFFFLTSNIQPAHIIHRVSFLFISFLSFCVYLPLTYILFLRHARFVLLVYVVGSVSLLFSPFLSTSDDGHIESPLLALSFLSKIRIFFIHQIS